jgi:hypothetical protein
MSSSAINSNNTFYIGGMFTTGGFVLALYTAQLAMKTWNNPFIRNIAITATISCAISFFLSYLRVITQYQNLANLNKVVYTMGIYYGLGGLFMFVYHLHDFHEMESFEIDT